MVQLLYTLLGSVSIWIAPGRVRANCPTDFSGTYKNTQVILDCTEMRCQTPSSLLLQSEVFSTYKTHCTFKALIGMSPHGAMTFASALFEGSISENKIFRHSGITSLLTPEMDIMVDKGFLVDKLVPEKSIAQLFCPSKLKCQRWMSLEPSPLHVLGSTWRGSSGGLKKTDFLTLSSLSPFLGVWTKFLLLHVSSQIINMDPWSKNGWLIKSLKCV